MTNLALPPSSVLRRLPYTNRGLSVSPGGHRRAARLSRGMTLAQVGSVLHMHPKSLSRLEADDAPVFADFKYAKCVLYDLYLGLYDLTDVT